MSLCPRLHSIAPLVAASLALFLAGCAGPGTRPTTVPVGSTAKLTLLETTDIHAHVLGFDYYRLQDDPHVGLSRAATLIEKARKRYTNTLLFDAGDTIQGSVLADYQALVNPVDCDEELAVFKVMDAIGYDGGTAGNHEFNYGLKFLSQVTGTPMHIAGMPLLECHGPDYPIVLANVFSLETGKPIFRPWAIIHSTIRATTPDGRSVEAPLSIGLIGFTPPRIMEWDEQTLKGKVRVMGLVEAAEKYLPEIEAQRPDLIIGIVHGGITRGKYTSEKVNAVQYLAKVPGFDALMMGHQHTVFPGPRFDDLPGIDDERGTVHGVPAVMGGFFGKDIGLVHLELAFRDGQWHSDAAAAHSETWPICPERDQCVPADPSVAAMVAKVQQGAVAYVNTPIGATSFRMSSYFADLGDMTAVAAVNAAQRARVTQAIADSHPELVGIPVLSAAAAFRTGFAGPDDYTDVPAGKLSIRNAADLYYYPNTLAAVKIDGAGLKAWLERAAGRFNRIDPHNPEPQALISKRFPGYNFDQLAGAGLHYVIDVSKPRGQRIIALTLDGQPVQPDQAFIVATNNYRASGGGGFPGMDGSRTVLAPEIENRQVLINWLRAAPTLEKKDFVLDSWDFAPLDTAGPVTITSASGKLDVARMDGLDNIRLLQHNGDGTSTYAVDLSKPE